MASQGRTPEEIEADNKAFQEWQNSFGGDYIGKKKKSQWWDQRNKTYRERGASEALAGKPGSVLSGSAAEQAGQVAGLNLGTIGYGQGLTQTGQDIQRVKQLQQQRTAQSGSDPVSAAIMGQKASAMAGAQRSMQSSGVKGGVAAGAADAIGRQRDAEIAASLYGQQRQSIADERSLAGNMLAGQTSLMQGERAANIQQPSMPQSSGMFGTVICTELHRQGIMPSEIYLKDSEYGKTLPLEVIVGYHFWAIPLVTKMQKSPLLTSIVKVPAMSWAKHIAGVEKSIFGYFCQYVGESVCGVLGKIVLKSSGEKYV